MGLDKGPAFLLHKEGCTIDDYRLVVRIGEGSFGEVWKAERAGVAVALKILKTSLNSEETQREIKSLDTLRSLNHKYLLHTRNFWSDGDRLYIEMELADGGTLKERLEAYLAAGQRGIPEDELLKFFSEAAQGLDYLHGHRPLFLHRDIKPANILLVQGCAKLGDFGLLRQVAGDHSSTKTHGGTFPYMAPESITSDVFSPYTDLFALAVTYVHVRQGELPFPGNNQYQICERILRSEPDLSDIFHPEEKRVLLKALDKDPRERYASCGEFMFELNRAVPWAPALRIPVMKAPAKAGASVGSTGRQQPRVEDPGTSRKRPPVTSPEIELPPDAAAAAGATGWREDRVAIAERKSGPVGPTVEIPQPAPETMAAIVRVEPAPVPGLAATRQRKRPPWGLIAVAASVVVIALVVGIWFLISEGTRSSVHELIANKKFPEALTAIRDANRLFLPNPSPLQSEVEEKWFTELREPGPAAGTEVLVGTLRDLNEFSEAFPTHELAKARRAKLVTRFADVLTADVDLLLSARNVAAARDLVAKYQSALPDGARTVQLRIDDKEKVLSLLKRSGDLLARKDFEGCLELFRTASVAFDNADDQDAKAKDIAAAKNGAIARDESHAKLVSAFEEAVKSNKTTDVKARVEALLTFRRGFAKRDWLPDVSKYQASTTVPSDRYALAWRPLLTDPVAVDLSRRQLQEVRKQIEQPSDAQRLEDTAVETLIRAHEVSSPASRKALSELIAILNRTPVANFAGNLWVGLARLELGKDIFQFDDLDALPPPSDEASRRAAAELYGHALDRLVKQGNYAWLPDAAQAAKCVAWCKDRFGPPTGTLAAFYAECLILTGTPVQQLNGLALPKQGDWYVSYVHALVLDKQTKPDDAAEMLAKRTDDAKEVAKTLKLAEGRFSAKQAAAAYKLNGYRLLGRAYRLELKRAREDLRQERVDAAIDRSARAQEFAQRWKQVDLESAADLNGEAVALEASAAFVAAKTDRGDAKYRVFERVAQKAGAGGQFSDPVVLPVVAAQLDFACGPRTARAATSDDCASSHLQDAIAAGTAALNLAGTEAAARKTRTDWWSVLECRLMVRLAEVRMRAVMEQAKERAAKKEDVTNAKWYTGELRGIRELYENARQLNKYPERWKGELAYNLGVVNYFLRSNDPEASDQAARAFRASRKSVNTIPEPYPAELREEILEKRNLIEITLKSLAQ
jgi:hypothetical protein